MPRDPHTGRFLPLTEADHRARLAERLDAAQVAADGALADHYAGWPGSSFRLAAVRRKVVAAVAAYERFDEEEVTQ